MENCTSGKEFKTCVGKLHTWILEEIRDIGNYILILKHLKIRRGNSHDAKASALYKMLYVKTGRTSEDQTGLQSAGDQEIH